MAAFLASLVLPAVCGMAVILLAALFVFLVQKYDPSYYVAPDDEPADRG